MKGEWQRQQSRVRATWRDTFLYAAVAGALFVLALLLSAGTWRVVLLVLAAAAGGAGMIRGTYNYMQAIDEQERDANLWGCYVGMCVYLALFMVTQAAQAFGATLPLAELGVFSITIFTVLGVYAWKRFR